MRGYAIDPSTIVIKYDDGCKEIRHGGSMAWRNNIPGNIETSRHHPVNKFGSIGQNLPYEIYPDEQTGFKAIITLFKTPTYQAKTLQNALSAYAPSNENNTALYYEHINKWTGIPLSTKISSLNDAQLNQLAKAIQRKEGWVVGEDKWQYAGTILNEQ